MGWRRELQRASSAARRAQQERDRSVRGVHREADRWIASIDRDVERAERALVRAHEQLERDPIKALNIQYSERDGFTSEMIDINCGIINASLGLTHTAEDSNPTNFEPDGICRDQSLITPRSAFFTSFGIFVAITVETHDPENRIQLNWVKKTNPQSSAVFLVDEANNEYYYPRWHTLTGEVVPRAAKTGIIGFEPLRTNAGNLVLHLSNIKIRAPKRTVIGHVPDIR